MYYVRFFNSCAGLERGGPDECHAGPFEAVQLTYDAMRDTAHGDEFAFFTPEGWKHRDDTYTDAVIYSA